MRANPGLDTATAITELGVGEALISLLDEKGRPQPSNARSYCRRHRASDQSATDERAAIIKSSVIFGHYEQTVDRESAYEKLEQPRCRQTGSRGYGHCRVWCAGVRRWRRWPVRHVERSIARQNRPARRLYAGHPRRGGAKVRRARNVVGLMPHPERAILDLLGSADGTYLLRSLIAATTPPRPEGPPAGTKPTVPGEDRTRIPGSILARSKSWSSVRRVSVSSGRGRCRPP